MAAGKMNFSFNAKSFEFAEKNPVRYAVPRTLPPLTCLRLVAAAVLGLDQIRTGKANCPVYTPLKVTLTWAWNIHTPQTEAGWNQDRILECVDRRAPLAILVLTDKRR
jgi:hypothetical protein